MKNTKFIPHIEKRWSPYEFIDKNIDNNILLNILDAARQAPSSYNEQPWRFIVGNKNDDTYGKILSTLAEPNKKWAEQVPVLILSAASTSFTKNGNPNGYNLYDLGQSVAFMILQAAEHNVYAHQMGGFSKTKAAEVFELDEAYVPGSVIALGYIEDETEPKRRVRKPLGDVVHSDSLGLKAGDFRKRVIKDVV